MYRRFEFSGLGLDVVSLDMSVDRFDCCLGFRDFGVVVVGLYMPVSFGVFRLWLFVV